MKQHLFYIPSSGPNDWRPLLEKPKLHWKTGYSAKALAYCWEEAKGFPAEIRDVFDKSSYPVFHGIKMLVAFPEYPVELDTYGNPSMNDIFILAIGNGQLTAITVEGKVGESFDKPVNIWRKEKDSNKPARLHNLCNILNIQEERVGDIYYQLIHRTASALIQAKEYNANNALMLVHSFYQGDQDQNFGEYRKFLGLFRVKDIKPNKIYEVGERYNGIRLYLGWVKGDAKYLDGKYLRVLYNRYHKSKQ